jgi:hypothetical protein
MTESGSPPSFTVPDWYLDPANRTGCASNSNSCTSATCGSAGIGPCVTVGEVTSHRWGTISPMLPQTTTLHLLSSETLNQEAIVLNPTTVGNGPSMFIIDGSLGLSTVASFSLGAVTQKTRGNPGTLLQVANLPAGAAAGEMIYDSAHPSYAFIDSMNGSTGTITQPLDAPTLTTPNAEPAPSEVDWLTSYAGDAAVLYALPGLNLRSAQPTGGDAPTTGALPTFWMQDVRVLDSSGAPGNSTINFEPIGMGTIVTNSRIDSYFNFDGRRQYIAAAMLNTWLPGCGMEFFATISAGALCTQATWGSHVWDLAGVDGDVIVHEGLYLKGSYNIIGLAYFDGSITPQVAVIHGNVVELEPSGALTSTATQLWGPGSMNLESPESAIENESGTTWANILTMGAITIDGATTGTMYDAGVFTDGVSITPAMLDLHNGLQNPRTGSRFSTN